MKAEVPRGSACPGACSPVLPPMHHQHTQGAPFSFISWHFQIWELRTCSGLFLRPFLPKPLIPTKCVSQLVGWLVIILSISLPPQGFTSNLPSQGGLPKPLNLKLQLLSNPHPNKHTFSRFMVFLFLCNLLPGNYVFFICLYCIHFQKESFMGDILGFFCSLLIPRAQKSAGLKVMLLCRFFFLMTEQSLEKLH